MQRQLLIENITVNLNIVKKQSLTLAENKQILHEGKAQKCIGVYTFPISIPDKKNENGRIYPTALWERVIAEGMGEGAYGLMDHPENGDFSPANAWCVWHNIRFAPDKQYVLADAHLFGPHGRFAEDALLAGGKIGISSCGYGDFKPNSDIIEESTYELQRPGDWVLSPSFGIYGTVVNKLQESKNNKTRIVIKEEIRLPETDIILEKGDTIKVLSEGEKKKEILRQRFRDRIKKRVEEQKKKKQSSLLIERKQHERKPLSEEKIKKLTKRQRQIIAENLRKRHPYKVRTLTERKVRGYRVKTAGD